jgi:endonuclease/exonuclease/phosphatase family metal-dependent hydrolase
MKGLILLLAVLPLVSADATDVRVLTFNIRYSNKIDGLDGWENRREAAAKLIAGKADLAGLQEVKPDQRQWLAEHLPDFTVVGIGREPGDKDEAAPVVFRKERFELLASGTFWLSEKPEEPGSKGWDAKLPRVCTWAKLRDRQAASDKEAVLWFYNVHLDHMGEESRLKGLGLVTDRMAARAGDERALLTGDFNTTADEPPSKMLAAREKPALISSYQALGLEPVGTFHAFKGKTTFGAIDFIYAEKERWTFKSSEVLKTTYPGVDGKPRYVSDHFPVQAVLSPK